MTVRALVLFSGGLDSILACRVLMRQGIDVLALKFVSPFFDPHILDDVAGYVRSIQERHGIAVQVRDIGETYLRLLRQPRHGYGKHFNPCLDCKILMLSLAREMLPALGASFLATGEVVGQRPMSQRRDTLRVVARDSGCLDGDASIVLRPLCAKNLEPSAPERAGLVDREQLLDFSGRTRLPQMALAREFGITDYPSPAGGCLLTDPIVGERVKTFYAENHIVTVADMRLIRLGRQFRLPGGSWLVLGRREAENGAIAALAQTGDLLLAPQDRPGPTGLLRHMNGAGDLATAAGLVLLFSKKNEQGETTPGLVTCQHVGGDEEMIRGVPPGRDEITPWRR